MRFCVSDLLIWTQRILRAQLSVCPPGVPLVSPCTDSLAAPASLPSREQSGLTRPQTGVTLWAWRVCPDPGSQNHTNTVTTSPEVLQRCASPGRVPVLAPASAQMAATWESSCTFPSDRPQRERVHLSDHAELETPKTETIAEENRPLSAQP